MSGFNPQPFITTTTSNNVNDDFFEEQKGEERKGKDPPKFNGNYGLLFFGYYQYLNQIISYEPN